RRRRPRPQPLAGRLDRMSTANAVALPAGLAGTQAQASRFWQSRAPRERQLIAAMAAAVVVLLVWLIAVRPALNTLRETPAELDRLDSQLQQMQIAAFESTTLRAAAPVPPQQAAEALRAAT